MDLELDKREKKLFEMISETKSRGRYSLAHSWVHIKRAWALREIDPEMAAFRAITAEEEAATGVIHAVKDRGYDNADKLSPRDHTHKAAIHPFFQILSDFFYKTIQPSGLPISLKIDTRSHPHSLKICFPMMIDDQKMEVTPDPPLNLNIKVDGKPVSFKQSVDDLATLRNVTKVETYIKNKANERNQLLYAGANGIPQIKGDLPEEGFTKQRAKIISMAQAYLLIEPYKEKQPFVQQSLDAFLKMIGRIDPDHLHADV